MKNATFFLFAILMLCYSFLMGDVVKFQSFESGSDDWSYTANPTTFNTGSDVWAVVDNLNCDMLVC